jgi:hypothetical protein
MKEGLIMFENIKVGDIVWSCTKGRGRVMELYSHGFQAIKVKFERVFCDYQINGKCNSKDKHPELYWQQFDAPLEAYIPPDPPKYQWLYRDQKGDIKLSKECYSDIGVAQQSILGHVMCLIAETRA